jgi:F-type H+-transporting ATPase subunit c
MRKFKFVFFAVLAIALLSVSSFAQTGGIQANADTVAAYKALAAGLGFGLAAGLGGIGQGLIGSKAVEGAARNPGAAGTVQTMMIIGLALIESLVLFALVIVFVVLR